MKLKVSFWSRGRGQMEGRGQAQLYVVPLQAPGFKWGLETIPASPVPWGQHRALWEWVALSLGCSQAGRVWSSPVPAMESFPIGKDL